MSPTFFISIVANGNGPKPLSKNKNLYSQLWVCHFFFVIIFILELTIVYLKQLIRNSILSLKKYLPPSEVFESDSP